MKSGGNVACARGFEPPTFGSGVRHFRCMGGGGISGASERDRTSDLLITNQLLYRLSYAGLGGSIKLNESGTSVKSEA
jgi:hypothetical protein